MPAYSYVGWETTDPATDAPSCIVAFDDDEARQPVFVPVWSEGSSSRFAVIPLKTDATAKLTDVLQRLDPTCDALGQYSAGSLRVKAPQIPGDRFDWFLETAGLPVTEKNRFLAHRDLHFQLMVKLMQSPPAKQDERAWNRFVDAHEFTGAGTGTAQAVLDDFVKWAPELAPYIQDLPDRHLALMLDLVPSKEQPWEDYER